ncbi:MAG: large conductance mechanosensitive channel protein MscL [Bacillota bacterium]|nr:large conductance mechanosensitive channel protein MscL [Bacillota bacterium]
MLREVKAFLLRGSVLDLAVAVILGAAFGRITTSLVDDLLMPLLGIVAGGIDLTGLSWRLGKAVMT